MVCLGSHFSYLFPFSLFLNLLFVIPTTLYSRFISQKLTSLQLPTHTSNILIHCSEAKTLLLEAFQATPYTLEDPKGPKKICNLFKCTFTTELLDFALTNRKSSICAHAASMVNEESSKNN